jgi:hypothetical protein
MRSASVFFLAGLLVVSLLTACGGGGSGSSSTDTGVNSSDVQLAGRYAQTGWLTFMGTVYSPEWHDNYLYFSGFGYKGEVPPDGMLRDIIFRVYCTSPTECDWNSVDAVLDPMIVSGYTWQQAEGPTIIVDMVGGYIPEKGFTASNNKTCYSTSYDGGASWSSPELLTDTAWLSSVSQSPDGILMYANNNSYDGALYRYTLSTDGTSVDSAATPVVFETGDNRFYFNADVRFIDDGEYYMMYAEHVVDGERSVDALISLDGVTFHLETDSMFNGWTPSAYEQDGCILFYGKSILPHGSPDLDVDVFVTDRCV